MRAILVAGAHPDDETFFTGTMAKYCEQGVRVAVLCGTRGERGSTADLCSIEELPKFREAELRASMDVIGVARDDVHFLPYEDQKLAGAPLEEVRRQIATVIRRTQPEIVVTFDPHGANGHTDHVAMTRFVLDAIPAASDPRWYADAGAPFSVKRLLWQPPLRLWSLPESMNLAAQPGVDFLIDTARSAAKKEAAIRKYRTQFPGLGHLFFEGGYPERTMNVEAFRLGWGPRPNRLPADDFFDGL